MAMDRSACVIGYFLLMSGTAANRGFALAGGDEYILS